MSGMAALIRSIARRRATRPPEGQPNPGLDREDAERRERLAARAFLGGDIPAVWYRQQMGAIAADTERHQPRR
jgi:hypothetical protein